MNLDVVSLALRLLVAAALGALVGWSANRRLVAQAYGRTPSWPSGGGEGS